MCEHSSLISQLQCLKETENHFFWLTSDSDVGPTARPVTTDGHTAHKTYLSIQEHASYLHKHTHTAHLMELSYTHTYVNGHAHAPPEIKLLCIGVSKSIVYNV